MSQQGNCIINGKKIQGETRHFFTKRVIFCRTLKTSAPKGAEVKFKKVG